VPSLCRVRGVYGYFRLRFMVVGDSTATWLECTHGSDCIDVLDGSGLAPGSLMVSINLPSRIDLVPGLVRLRFTVPQLSLEIWKCYLPPGIPCLNLLQPGLQLRIKFLSSFYECNSTKLIITGPATFRSFILCNTILSGVWGRNPKQGFIW